MREPEGPVPRRYWWLKRLGMLGVVALIGVVALRLWWGAVARGRLDEQIARIRARGEPILLEDFATEPVADGDNAALALKRAAAIWNDRHEETGNDRQYLRDNAEAMTLVRRARSLPGCDWGQRFKSPAVSGLLSANFGLCRDLAKGLSHASGCAHRLGDDAQALEAVRDVRTVARAMALDSPALITLLVAISFDSIAVSALESLAPELRIGASDEASGDGGASASPTQVRAVIADLVDDRTVFDGARRAVLGERAIMLDAATALGDGRLSPSTLYPGAWTGAPPSWEWRLAVSVQPLLDVDARRALQYGDAYLRILGEGRWRTDVDAMLRGPGTTAWAHVTSPLMFDLDYGVSLRNFFRIVARSRMAAIALALRLYEVDHGARPARLADLVPDYLPVVPEDPFADQGRTFVYRPEGGGPMVSAMPPPHSDADETTASAAMAAMAAWPLLYTIGDDGIDQGCQDCFDLSGEVNWRADDLPFRLVRPVLPSAPATSEEAVEGQNGERDGSRDGDEDQDGEGEP